MWKLISKTGRVHYILPEKQKHVVGRTNADLILKDDTSISRSHAYLFPFENHVELIDIGSKYGTFYNENIDHKIAMEKNIAVELKNGERVRFGVLQNEWILSKMKLVTLTSTVTSEQKKQLKEILTSLNGEIIESFAPNCTHLTMRSITVTPKLLYALVERIPIVNFQYWRDFLIELRNGNLPPNAENYLPEIAEEFLKFSKHLLKPNECRKTLFAGKTFVFIGKKHYDTYDPIIQLAGGTTKNLNQGIQKSFLTQKNVILIQYIPTTQSQSTQTIDDIADYLKDKSIRMVPDYEIGLALVYCSIEKYCNPKFNVILDVISPTKKSKTTQLKTIAVETPINQYINSNDNNTPLEIPESNIYELQNESEKRSEYSEKKNQVSPNSIEIDDDSEQFNIEMKVQLVTKNNTDNFRNENITSTDCVPLVHKKNDNNLKKTPLLINQNENKRKHNNINEDSKNMKRFCRDEKNEVSKFERDKSKKRNINEFVNSSQIIKVTPKDINGENNVEKCLENEKVSKRGRFALITSDDEDDSDLFEFGHSRKKSKPENKEASSSISQNCDNANKQSKNLLQTPNTVIGNKSTAPRITRVIKLPEPIQVISKKSIQIIPGEWLSKSLIKLEIKNEDKTVEADETDSKINDLLHSDWFNSIKGGFEVRTKEMNLTVQTRRNMSLEENNVSSSLGNYNGKNFKAFVKKRNFIPQKEIVTTVPFQIHGFSF